jgi:hypothetical protein
MKAMLNAPTYRLMLCTAYAVLLLLVLSASAVAAVPKSGSDSVGFSVSPLRYDLSTAAGSSSTHPITITNTDDVAGTFSFAKQDFRGDKEDPAATPVMLGGKFDSSISGYDWITTPSAITIPAGQKRTVYVKVSAPSGAVGGHYAALTVNGPARSAGDVIARSKIAVLFLMNAGGALPPDIKIEKVVTTTGGGTTVIYKNEGTTDTTPDGTIDWTDPVTGDPVSTEEGECTTALPGGLGQCTFDSDRGDAGDESVTGGSKADIQLVTEDGEKTKAAIPTEWAGTWTSLLLPIVGLTLFVLYFLFLRRRRKEREAAEGQLADGEWPLDY